MVLVKEGHVDHQKKRTVMLILDRVGIMSKMQNRDCGL